MTEQEDAGRKFKHPRKQRIEFDKSKCWFCLASPSVEKHLVVTVGNSTYLALAKGKSNSFPYRVAQRSGAL